MSKILKNQTASAVVIDDVGVSVPASSQITIQATDDLLFASSDDVVTLVGNGTLVVNDGTNDLSISDGIDLIKGLFPSTVSIEGVSDVTINPNDALLDKSNRLRTVDEKQLFSATFNYNKQPLLFTEVITGTGTIDAPAQNESTYLKFNSSTTSGDEIMLRSKRYFRYQTNRQHNLNFSCIFGAGDANQEARVGVFSGFNGLYFANLNGTINIGIRDNIDVASPNFNETNVPKSSWNYDKLDGTGPSGLNLSNSDLLENVVTYYIDYLWHGANGVTFGISYFNRRVPVHNIEWTATQSKPFLRSALLPFAVHIKNTGTLSAATLFELGPVAYDVSGGDKREFGYRWSDGNKQTFKTVTGSFTNVLAIRPKEFYESVRNRGTLVLEEYNIRSDNEVFYEVIIGATVTGGTWTSVDNDSLAEKNVGAFSYTGGRVIDEGFAGSGTNNVGQTVPRTFAGDLFLAQDAADNTLYAVVIRAIRITSNAEVSASVEWREVY